jgi:RND superfamily putative drug exporter
MVTAIARFAVRRRKAVLAAAALFVLLSIALGAGVVSRMSGAGFNDPASASSRAARALSSQFHSGTPNFVLLVKAAGGVDDADAAAAGKQLTAQLAAEQGVANVLSYWTAGRAPVLRSTDRTEAMVVARLVGGDDNATTRAHRLDKTYAGTHGPLTVRAGGVTIVYGSVKDHIQRDLSRAEMIVFPVTFVLLVLVFGGVVAALLPLVIGAISIVGTLLVLRVMTSFTDVSVYSLNLTTGLGLGLAIDYALFVVTRYREELARGSSYDDAVIASARTAGRTVAFSATTVALSLAALLVFPLFFLRSFGYAGIAVVVIAALGALLVLPALLSVLGPRINKWQIFARKPADSTHGFWHTTALAVMRRPLVAGLAVIALLIALGLPFLNIRFSLPDDRVLPSAAAAQQTQQALRDDFSGRAGEPVILVSPTADVTPAAEAAYAGQLSRLPGVDAVRPIPGGTGRGFAMAVIPRVEAMSAAAKTLVHDIRRLPAPSPVLVGGRSAELVDTEQSLTSKLPLAGLVIAAAMFAVLFMFTGSVIVPIKALILNLLSLTATFGAMVWIFQQGHLGWLVGHPITTGALDTTMPILMFCVAFGLSMDYEVFLLSRIKETYDAGADNTTAVAVGLERTGRLITAAAALIAVVWISFISSSVTFIKMLGLGMALAVIVDATLVRGVLVPAFMRLAGDWNWWAPRPLRRLHNRFGVREADEMPITRGCDSAERAPERV